MLFMTICTITVIIVLFKFFKRRVTVNDFAKHFNGPPRHPILGNLLLFPKDIPEIFQVLMGFHDKYGKNVMTWGVLNDNMLQITNQKDVEAVLLAKTTQAKSNIYQFMNPWLGTGLLTSHGKKWFQRRKIITPTFHFKILEQFIDVFNRQSDILIEKLEQHVNKGAFNVYDNVTLFALDVICEAAMGVSINAQYNPNTEYVLAVKEMSEIVFRRIFSILASYPLLFQLTPLAWRQRNVVKILHNFTNTVIRDRKEQLRNKPILVASMLSDHNDSEYDKKKLTFLDLLLTATVDGQPLPNDGIREEVDTFMFEGHDTTTSGISFALYNLAKNQEIQQRVFEELQSIFGDDKKVSATYSNYQDMKYLEMVIKESLRLFPPVAIIARTTTEETVVANVKIPKDVDISIPIFQIHRDADIFPDPLKFDPERFTEENCRARGPYDYIPFSAGPRNCIGQRFAMLELKSAISKILRNYHILPDVNGPSQIKYKSDLILRPVDGIHIELKRRVY